MTENREPLRVYIAVDPTKIVRCQWCGAAESEEWHRTRYGVYCSMDCFYAAQANGYLCAYIIEVASSSFLVGVVSPSALLVGIPLIMLLFSPCLIWTKRGWDHQKNMPRDSRRDDVTSDLALLKTISSGVSCPRCNANIDVRKIGTDRVYNCEYCGASGTIEFLRSQ